MSPAAGAGAGAIPVAVLGGTGYVAGELLRLLAHHPGFRVSAMVSSSQAGQRITDAFPHLRGTAVAELVFESPEDLERRFERGGSLGIFAATPHGATALLLDRLLAAAERRQARAHVVDLSADFRFPDARSYEDLYRKTHPAPDRLRSFLCSLPEHHEGRPPEHVAHPGCFTTAVVLGAYPLFALDLVEGDLFASAVTGSSGSGRAPGQGTHHPERRSNFHAYAPLAHRHEPEMRRLLGLSRKNGPPEVRFVPHSGPFVRGIHATLGLTLRAPQEAGAVLEAVQGFYRNSAFIGATLAPPQLTEVVGTNRCRLGIAARGRTLIVTSVIDNLVKGAAGGAIQWMNRIFDLPDDTGLRLPGLGWY